MVSNVNFLNSEQLKFHNNSTNTDQFCIIFCQNKHFSFKRKIIGQHIWFSFTIKYNKN